MNNPGASGYIAIHIPHAINNILVGDLGHEEILLLATDSGNIAAYRIERIFAFIEEGRASGCIDPSANGAQVECFFSDWVGQSAWGLAIHKFARIIAVSSNTSYITVFAFALVDPTSKSNSSGEVSIDNGAEPAIQSQDWMSVGNRAQFAKLRRLIPHSHRARNVRLTFEGHTTNIPNVSFLNCDLDPEGNWMVSTDIDNKLLVWKIWEQSTPVNVYDFYTGPRRRLESNLFDE
jgi:hypothetical protein